MTIRLTIYFLGFVSALIAYNYKSLKPFGLWDYAFYHFIAVAFVLYLLEGVIGEKKAVLKVVRLIPLTGALGALIDEIRGKAGVFDITEYIVFGIISVMLIYIAYLIIKER